MSLFGRGSALFQIRHHVGQTHRCPKVIDDVALDSVKDKWLEDFHTLPDILFDTLSDHALNVCLLICTIIGKGVRKTAFAKIRIKFCRHIR